MTPTTVRLGTDQRDLEIYRRLFEANGYPRSFEYMRWSCAVRGLPLYGMLSFDPQREPAADGLPKATAIYTTLSAPFQLGSETALVVQSMDTMTDEPYRGRGLLVLLATGVYDAAARDGVPLVYGFPSKPSRHGMFVSMKWTCLNPVPFLIRPLRTGYFLRRLVRRERFKAWLPDLPLPRWPRRTVLPGLKIEQIDAFPDDTDELWHKFSAAIQVGMVRDRAYLDWRYLRKPGAAYRIFAARRGGSLAGLVVVRDIDKHGGHIGYLMELLFVPGLRGVAHALVAHATGDLARRGCDAVVSWWFSHSPGYAAFPANGFLPMPEKLRPIELHFGYRAFDPRFEALLRERRNWHLSYSDSDTV